MPPMLPLIFSPQLIEEPELNDDDGAGKRQKMSKKKPQKKDKSHSKTIIAFIKMHQNAKTLTQNIH